MHKHDIGTSSNETFIRVYPTEAQREHFMKHGVEPIAWDYGLVNGRFIGRRRAETNDEFLTCRAVDVPVSVAAMLLAPESVEITDSVLRDRIIDQMVNGALDALLWTETLYSDENPDDTPMDALGFHNDNIDPKSLERLRDDCTMFLNLSMRAGIDVAQIYDPEACIFPMGGRGEYFDWHSIGFDFILSRNGHGSGFFDRDIPHNNLFDHIADRFTEISAYTNAEPNENGAYTNAEWGIE